MRYGLSSNAIDIWVCGISDVVPRHNENLLSSDERITADSYAHEQARLEFIAGRVAVRIVLGRLLGLSPDELVFAQLGGKPCLPAAPALHFNLSHGAGQVAVAASSLPVGVDIERVDLHRPVRGVVDEFFHDSEKRYLSRLGGETRQAAFFRLWTHKEAVLKALGSGLDFPTNRFAVRPGGGSVYFEPEAEQPETWSTVTLRCEPGYCLAVAVPDPAPAVRLHHGLPVNRATTAPAEQYHAQANP